MDKKDQRNSVPLGTFRPSSAPPAPAAGVQRPFQLSDGAGSPARPDDTVQTRLLRGSEPSPEAGVGESERKRVRTLVGVPTPPAETLARSAQVSYPSPPKWRRPSERNDEPTVRDPVLGQPVARIELRSEPAPQRLAAVEENTANIADAIQQMLDEQASVPLLEVGEEVQRGPQVVVEAQPVVTHPSPPPPPQGRPSSSLPPVMLPAHVAALHARETEQVAQQVARRSSTPPAPVQPLASPPISSVAPAEVRRRASWRDDATPGLGFMVVAAMAAVFVVGWLATAGGYQRTGGRSFAAAPAPAPKPAPVSSVSSSTEPAPRDVPSASAAAAADAPATAAVSAAPSAAVRRPQLMAASARVVQVDRPLAPVASVEPVVRIVARDEASTANAAPAVLAAPAPPPPAGQPLADTPSREEVLARIDALRAEVSQCAQGRSGIAELDITIAGAGTVTSVVVGGDFSGTPEGSCIARTVRKARFPQFTKERFRLLYPLSL